MNEFYVYIYLDPRKPGLYIYEDLTFDYEPFYVGKGKGNRFQKHLIEKFSGNRHKHNKIQKIREANLEPIILKLKENLSEEEAWNLENLLIEKIGRYYLKTGPLTNLKDGGTGGFTHINTLGLQAYLIEKYGEEEGSKKYKEGIEKSAKSSLGRTHSRESVERQQQTKAKTLAQHPEIMDGISKSLKKYYETHDSPSLGILRSDETKKKISATLKDREDNKGINNRNFGRSMETRLLEKYGAEEGQKRYASYVEKQRIKTIERWADPIYKEKMSKKHRGILVGEKNPMYKKSTQQVLLEKWGAEEGAVKWEEYKKKISIGRKGKGSSFKGKKKGPISEETRQKMKESQRARRKKESQENS